jgi:hypothetical protein
MPGRESLAGTRSGWVEHTPQVAGQFVGPVQPVAGRVGQFVASGNAAVGHAGLRQASGRLSGRGQGGAVQAARSRGRLSIQGEWRAEAWWAELGSEARGGEGGPGRRSPIGRRRSTRTHLTPPQHLTHRSPQVVLIGDRQFSSSHAVRKRAGPSRHCRGRRSHVSRSGREVAPRPTAQQRGTSSRAGDSSLPVFSVVFLAGTCLQIGEPTGERGRRCLPSSRVSTTRCQPVEWNRVRWRDAGCASLRFHWHPTGDSL